MINITVPKEKSAYPCTNLKRTKALKIRQGQLFSP